MQPSRSNISEDPISPEGASRESTPSLQPSRSNISEDPISPEGASRESTPSLQPSRSNISEDPIPPEDASRDPTSSLRLSRDASPEPTLRCIYATTRELYQEDFKILLSKKNEIAFSKSFLILSKLLLPRMIEGKKMYIINLSELKNLNCVCVLTLFPLLPDGGEYLDDTYIDRVVLFESHVLHTDHVVYVESEGCAVAASCASASTLGLCFSPLLNVCGSTTGTRRLTRDEDIAVLAEILEGWTGCDF